MFLCALVVVAAARLQPGVRSSCGRRHGPPHGQAGHTECGSPSRGAPHRPSAHRGGTGAQSYHSTLVQRHRFLVDAPLFRRWPQQCASVEHQDASCAAHRTQTVCGACGRTRECWRVGPRVRLRDGYQCGAVRSRGHCRGGCRRRPHGRQACGGVHRRTSRGSGPSAHGAGESPCARHSCRGLQLCGSGQRRADRRLSQGCGTRGT
mmetsp:Transcript_35334/g.88816  ORF Transcript_35334/g.88816 Transcript_35334/m.88816 type:complete len:206 (+) Transcript_35334:289-906(+)